jgi:hypothetical protein
VRGCAAIIEDSSLAIAVGSRCTPLLKHKIKALTRKLGFEIFYARHRYSHDGLFTVHNAEFRALPAFRAAYQRGVQASRGVDPQFEWRVHVAIWAARTALSAEGAFVECGVNAGFMSSAILHALDWNAQGRSYYLVDTWEGPPLDQYSAAEVAKGRVDVALGALDAGAYVCDFDRVRDNFSEWPDVRLVRGRVPAILSELAAVPAAFLHIDMNSAAPEVAALAFFWPRMDAGAVILLDDYACAGHEQQKRAMDDAASRLGADILSLPTGQGLIIKGVSPGPSSAALPG